MPSPSTAISTTGQYSYDPMIDGKHHSTSLAVVELVPAAKGTDMTFTEFVAWHDGSQLAKGLASRQHGTSWQFDKVAEVLETAR